MNSRLYLILFILILISCCSKSTFNSTSNNTSPPLLSSPIYDINEATGIGSLYHQPPSKTGEGYHSGVDITFEDKEGGRIKSVCDGVVTSIGSARSHADPTIDVWVRYNDEYIILYCFEPAKEILVSEGDSVKLGQVIGTIGQWEGEYAPVLHFEVDKDESPTCPMMYLSEEARQEFETLYNLNPINGLVDPCYEHPNGCPLLILLFLGG